MWVPYLSFTVLIGKLSKVHMPSSALAEEGAAIMAMAPATATIEAVAETAARSERSCILRNLPGRALIAHRCNYLDPMNRRRPSASCAAHERVTPVALPRFNLVTTTGVVT